MQRERVWVREAWSDGRAIIWMEADKQDAARATVHCEMTNAVLDYLYRCGNHPDELREIGGSLAEVLGSWWDERNSFQDPKDAKNDVSVMEPGQTRVFWQPVTSDMWMTKATPPDLLRAGFRDLNPGSDTGARLDEFDIGSARIRGYPVRDVGARCREITVTFALTVPKKRSSRI